jgi:hypothetical protein
MWRKLISLFLVFGIFMPSKTQFAPAAGHPNSTAIRYDSSCFVTWATSATVERGWRDIRFKDSGYADVGDAASVSGPALTKGVLSLGDSGTATLYFQSGIINGPGFDFAIFENAFNDSFLELAHVEISANGTDFLRFPSQSLSAQTKQTGAFDATNPEKIHNLAGKYRMPYGTPFNIDDIQSSSDSNFPNIFYFIRILDVVGSIDTNYATYDSEGRIINDPFPTPFPSSGFDLDAVGVIHPAFNTGIKPIKEYPSFQISPKENGYQIRSSKRLKWMRIMDLSGRLIYSNQQNVAEWHCESITPGIYIIQHPFGSKIFIAP